MSKPPRFASREEYEAWKRQRQGGDGAAQPGRASLELPPPAHALGGATPKCPTCSTPLTAPGDPCPECAPHPFESSGLELAERPARPASPALAEEPPALGPALPAPGQGKAPQPTDEERNAVRVAVGCGAFSGLVTTAVALYAMASGSEVLGLDGWSLLDGAALLALSYGTHRHSRACAVGLLGFFVIGKIAMFAESGRLPGIITSFVLAAGMLRGAKATFSIRARIRGWDQEQGLASAANG